MKGSSTYTTALKSWGPVVLTLLHWSHEGQCYLYYWTAVMGANTTYTTAMQSCKPVVLPPLHCSHGSQYYSHYCTAVMGASTTYITALQSWEPVLLPLLHCSHGSQYHCVYIENYPPVQWHIAMILSKPSQLDWSVINCPVIRLLELSMRWPCEDC